jgi:hypothetical protein
MSAAAAIGTFLSNVGIGLIAAGLGYVVDFINTTARTSFSLSHQTAQAMNILTWMLYIFAFCYLLASVYNFIMVSKSQAGGYG